MSKLFTLEVEYEDGHVDTRHTDILWITGLRRGNKRPVYVTLTCNEPNRDVTRATVQAVESLWNILSPTVTRGRIMIRPFSFFKNVQEFKSQGFK